MRKYDIYTLKEKKDDGIIRRILRTSVEDIMFIRVVRIFRMIEESVCNDCSSNYFFFKNQ